MIRHTTIADGSVIVRTKEETVSVLVAVDGERVIIELPVCIARAIAMDLEIAAKVVGEGFGGL